jgi:hypothetical protein
MLRLRLRRWPAGPTAAAGPEVRQRMQRARRAAGSGQAGGRARTAMRSTCLASLFMNTKKGSTEGCAWRGGWAGWSGVVAVGAVHATGCCRGRHNRRRSSPPSPHEPPSPPMRCQGSSAGPKHANHHPCPALLYAPATTALPPPSRSPPTPFPLTPA